MTAPHRTDRRRTAAGSTARRDASGNEATTASDRARRPHRSSGPDRIVERLGGRRMVRRLGGWRPLEHFTARSAAGLAGVIAAGATFGVLLLLVRLHWDPMRRMDAAVAQWLNAHVAPHGPVVTILEGLTGLGGRPIMLWLVAVVAVALLIRRRPRLAAYLVVTVVGALLLDPSVKLLVGRLRPMVDVPLSSAPGNSFPSGHALGATVVYGALMLVFLSAAGRRSRTVLLGVGVTMIAVIGLTRVALGVHYPTDVLGGWLLGVAWLGITAHAFQLWRGEIGRPPVKLRDGLEPEAAGDIRPAPDEHHVLAHPLIGVAQILTGWVLIFGSLYLFGTLVTRYADGTVVQRFDLAVVRWLAEHRTAGLDQVSHWWSKAGDTHAVMFVSIGVCAVLVAALRRWRPVLFLTLTMVGELTLFLASSGAVDRPRPPTGQLDGQLPTSAFPSGHIAATMCLYTAIAVLAFPRVRSAWRWLPVALAVVMPTGVALSRMYRGMHHPTDLIGAALLTAMWVGLLYWVIRPNSPDDPDDPDDPDKRPTVAAGQVPAQRRPETLDGTARGGAGRGRSGRKGAPRRDGADRGDVQHPQRRR